LLSLRRPCRHQLASFQSPLLRRKTTLLNLKRLQLLSPQQLSSTLLLSSPTPTLPSASTFAPPDENEVDDFADFTQVDETESLTALVASSLQQRIAFIQDATAALERVSVKALAHSKATHASLSSRAAASPRVQRFLAECAALAQATVAFLGALPCCPQPVHSVLHELSASLTRLAAACAALSLASSTFSSVARALQGSQPATGVADAGLLPALKDLQKHI
jgi:hypothetical protein